MALHQKTKTPANKYSRRFVLLRAVAAILLSDKYGGRLAAKLKTHNENCHFERSTAVRLRVVVRSRETCFLFLKQAKTGSSTPLDHSRANDPTSLGMTVLRVMLARRNHRHWRQTRHH